MRQARAASARYDRRAGRRASRPYARAAAPTAAKTAPSPKLIVLDLNGTLLYRSKTGKKAKLRNIVLRPYLWSFLRCLLGPQFGNEPVTSQRESIAAYKRPYGSHFWESMVDRVRLPPTGPFRLLIWSSATAENVNTMVTAFAPQPQQRGLFERVWARETLVTDRDLGRKVGTIKDLGFAWKELNDWQDYVRRSASDERQRPERSFILANARHREPQGARAQRDEHGLWGAANTLLIDDSVDKARQQPDNHLCIPEYSAQAADIYRNYLNAGASADAHGLDDYLLQCLGILEQIEAASDVRPFVLDAVKQGFHANQTEEERARLVRLGREALERREIPVVP